MTELLHIPLLNMGLCNIYLLFIVFKVLTAQVCNETKSVLRVVPETYQYTYHEAYEDDSCLIWCTKSRLAVNVGTRQVEKLVRETVSGCCDGYVEDDSYKGNGLKCIPLCNPPCDNGYCKNPNECACEVGYAEDPNNDLHRCIPLCLEGCNTPDCLSTCSQYDDYDSSETDMCYGTCLNGTCVAPGVCQCAPGYRRLLDVCQPICTACEHGTCIAPGICKCDFGWREECGSCQPFCSGCEHGQCKAPGQCECDAGYRAQNAQCEPYCLNCASGSCVAPGVCACNPGWYMNVDNTQCMAHCDVACGNGTCVAPNVCECYLGYKIRKPQERAMVDGVQRWYNEEPQCVPVCSNCEGVCVAPDVCNSEAQYDTIYATLNSDTEGLHKSETFAVGRNHLDEAISMSDANATQIDDTKNSKNNKSASCTNIKSDELTYHWIYIVIIVIELLVILIMLVVLKRKHLLDRLKIKKFVPQDNPNSEVAVHYTSSVVGSKLKEKDPGSL